MSVLPANVDYSDKDFDSLRARLLILLRQVFTDWTDETISNFGIILLEQFSFVGDVLTKYQDNAAGEAFIISATLRSSLINLAKLLGYVPGGRGAATVDETFTLTAVPAGDVTIPSGTLVRTSGAGTTVEFRLLADLLIPAGADPPTGIGTLENSTLNAASVTSSLLPNQRVVLSATPFVRAISVSAGNGIYTKVDNRLRSRADDRHFTVVVDAVDRATLVFGDGQNGEIPTGTIEISYTTGGGEVGNVGANTLTRVIGTFSDTLANLVAVTANNPARASGGTERETNASIRVNAPASLRVLNRTVAREDFEIAAITKTAPRTARALMLTSDQEPAIPENTGYLFLIPAGGGLPSQQLKDDVAAIFETRFEDGGLPKTVTFAVLVLDPVYVEINIFAVIYPAARSTAAAVRTSILANLASFFSITLPDGSPNPSIDFGFAASEGAGELALSDIMNAVRDATGVRKLGDGLTEFLVNGSHADVALGLREFPVLGTVNLINGATGNPLV